MLQLHSKRDEREQKGVPKGELQHVKDSCQLSLILEEVKVGELEIIGLCKRKRFLEEFSSFLNNQNVKQTSHIK